MPIIDTINEGRIAVMPDGSQFHVTGIRAVTARPPTDTPLEVVIITEFGEFACSFSEQAFKEACDLHAAGDKAARDVAAPSIGRDIVAAFFDLASFTQTGAGQARIKPHEFVRSLVRDFARHVGGQP